MARTITVFLFLILCSCRPTAQPAPPIPQQQPAAKKELPAPPETPKPEDASESDDESESLDERLMKAARFGKIPEIKALVKRGANINARQTVSTSQMDFSPLMLAIENGEIEAAKTLLALRADIHRKGTRFKTQKICEDNITALSIAVNSDSLEIARLLLDKGADANGFEAYSVFEETNSDDTTTWRRHKTRRTPLIFLARGPAMLALLLDRGADPNAVESVDRDSCLMEFATSGDRECVQLLLDRGANAAYRNRKGKTALDFARKNNFTEIAKLLSR